MSVVNTCTVRNPLSRHKKLSGHMIACLIVISMMVKGWVHKKIVEISTKGGGGIKDRGFATKKKGLKTLHFA